MMPVLSDWLTDQQVMIALGMSKRTLNELLAVAPAGAPVAFVSIGAGVRRPKRRWRPDLVWGWLEAVQAHIAGIATVRKPTPAAKARPKPRPGPETASAPTSLGARVRARQAELSR